MQNKGLIITLIIGLSILALSLLGFMFLLIDGHVLGPRFFKINKISTTKIFDKEYPTNFKNIKVDASISDIYFKKSSDNNVRVVVFGKKKELRVEEENEELSVRFQEKHCVGICFNRKKNKVEVYLPENYQGNIVVKNDYGDIRIDSFKRSNIEVEEDCGDVSIASGRKVTVKNNYGDIKIGEAKYANLKESCGDIEIRKVDDVIVKNNYGDISIKKVLNYIDAKEDCGDIEIDYLSINKDSSIKNSFGSIDIGSTSEIYIDAKTDLGDVDIERNSRTAKTILTVKNNCGDITVENNN